MLHWLHFSVIEKGVTKRVKTRKAKNAARVSARERMGFTPQDMSMNWESDTTNTSPLSRKPGTG